MMDRRDVCHQHQHEADDEQDRLEGRDRDDRVARLLRSCRRRHAQNRQADGDERDAAPLPPLKLKAEQALGEHRQDHKAAGDHRLRERQRR
jgi:hypothetical protein